MYSNNNSYHLEHSSKVGSFVLSAFNHDVGQYNDWDSITPGCVLRHSIPELRELRDMINELLGE
jgi:hypothetical protein